MTLAELATLLATSGYQVAYEHFDEQVAPQMPFICYSEVGSDNFSADNKVYLPVKKIQVQLFTKTKDLAAEQSLETALSNLFWQKEAEFVDNEICYRTIYTITI